MRERGVQTSRASGPGRRAAPEIAVANDVPRFTQERFSTVRLTALKK